MRTLRNTVVAGLAIVCAAACLPVVVTSAGALADGHQTEVTVDSDSPWGVWRP